MKQEQMPWLAAVVIFLIHLFANPHYGFFRDELYFIICGFHPQWGYVDQPPIIPLLSAGTQLFGHSLILLRAVPALFAAAGVYTTCLLVREYGGGVFAQVLASFVFLFTGVLLSFGMKVSTDTVGLFTWPLIALFVFRIAKGGDARLWLAAGATAGISVESKYSALFFIVALVVGLLLTPERRILASRWFAAGCAVMVLIALPNFLWQWHYGFPMLELLKNGQSGKNLIAGPLLYVIQEIIITNMFLAPFWIAGLIWLLVNPRLRFLGFAYVMLIAMMIVFHGKHYYPADVYPILIAAGAAAIASWTRNIIPLRLAIALYALVLGPVFMFYDLPLLSEDHFVAYNHIVSAIIRIPGSTIATERDREPSILSSDYADMHGWPELAAEVQKVYNSLSPQEHSQAVVFAGNYGEASAIAFFAPSVPVISGANQYWLWGTKSYSGNVFIQVGGTCFHSDHFFSSRRVEATFRSSWGISYEQNLPIQVCRGIRKPIGELWQLAKSFN